MPREIAPRSNAEFQSYWNGQLNRPEAHLTEDARRLGSAIMFEIPVPAWYGPTMKLHNLIMLGSLPRPVRELYGLRWSPAQAAACAALIAALRTPRPLAPRRIRAGGNSTFFDLVAATERARIARGDATPSLA